MAAHTSSFDTTDLTDPSLDDDPWAFCDDITPVEPHGPVDRSPSALVAGIHHMPASFTPVAGR